MANIKSAKKRIEITRIRTERNKRRKSAIKHWEKEFLNALNAGELNKAEENLRQAVKYINKARNKGALHDNTANRKISRLTIRLNKAKQGLTAKEA
ncbi:MAG: 30S ribosomal protein S20 [Thermoanaerobacteraceae bacterium]|nr:30S ribosomal protein S20 [Thermoanaerobacteraceae bacterium]